MEVIVVNAVGRLRRVIYNERRYLVVPMTLIVPGVLNGSSGRLFYPLQEIRRNFRDWNGIPIVINHPYDHLGGWLPAKADGVIERVGVGFLWRAKAKNKLTAEGWFDENRLRKIAPKVHNSLMAGRPVELSTGLGTLNSPVPPGTHYNGQVFDFVAGGYLPDHLAVLPDQVGACSIQHGCGVLVNSSSQQVLEAIDMGKKNKDANEPNPIGLTKNQLKRYRKALERELISEVSYNAGLANGRLTVTDNGSADATNNAANPNQGREGSGRFLAYGAGRGSGPAHEAAVAGAIHDPIGGIDDGPGKAKGDDGDENEPPDNSLVSELLDRMGGSEGQGGSGLSQKKPGTKNQDVTGTVNANGELVQLALLVGNAKDALGHGSDGKGASASADRATGKTSSDSSTNDKSAQALKAAKKGDSATAGQLHAELASEHGGLRDRLNAKAADALKGENRDPHVAAALTRLADKHDTAAKAHDAAAAAHDAPKMPGEAKGFEKEYKGFDPHVEHPGGTGAHVFEHKTDKGQDDFLDKVGGMPHPLGGRRTIITNESSWIKTLIAYNADWPQAKRDALDKKDFAGPHESFPIKDQKDVDHAASLTGHADNPEAVKGKVKAIAKRKGLSLPDAWQDKPKETQNMFNPTAHAASKDACSSSVDCAHEPAAAPGMQAMAASKAGNGPVAAQAHQDAAASHEQAATGARQAGDEDSAAGHDNAAALHRKAASMHSATANANQGGGNSTGGHMAFNRDAAIKKLTANCTCAADIKAIQNMSESTLKLMVGNDGGPASADGGPSPEPVRVSDGKQAGKDAGDDDLDMAEKAKKGINGNKDSVTKNQQTGQQQQLTLMQAINSYGTQAEKDAWANVTEFNDRLRTNLVNRLTTNAKTGKQKDDLVSIYKNMTTNQLKALVSAMPEPVVNEGNSGGTNNGEGEFSGLSDEFFPNFTGATGGNRHYAGNSGNDGFDKTAVLVPLTMNWEEEAKADEDRLAARRGKR